MKKYKSLPLYRLSIELAVFTEQLSSKMTRQYRYTYGERMVKAALKLPMDFYLIYSENYSVEKLTKIDCFIEHLVELKMILDVGYQLGVFNYKDFPIVLEKVDSIERQINGFKKTAKVSIIKGDG